MNYYNTIAFFQAGVENKTVLVEANEQRGCFFCQENLELQGYGN